MIARGLSFALIGLVALASTQLGALGQSASTDPGSAITARKALMAEAELVLGELELAAATGQDLAPLASRARSLAVMLQAFPLLFADDTNLLGGAPALGDLTTSADPRVFTEFDAFLAFNAAAEAKAREAEASPTPDSIAALRQSCQDCHATYLYYDPFAALGG